MVAPLALQILEVDRGAFVRPAAHHDDARARRVQQDGQQPAGERKVAQVIGPELHLEAVDGLAPRDGHDARVVDEDVQCRVPLPIQVGKSPHRREIGEIHKAELRAAPIRLLCNLSHRIPSTRLVAARHHHRRPMPGQLQSRIKPDSAVRPGDDRPPPGQIGNVVGRPPCHSLTPYGSLRAVPRDYASTRARDAGMRCHMKPR